MKLTVLISFRKWCKWMGNEQIFACNYSLGCIQYNQLPIKAGSWRAAEPGIAIHFFPL